MVLYSYVELSHCSGHVMLRVLSDSTLLATEVSINLRMFFGCEAVLFAILLPTSGATFFFHVLHKY